MLYRVGGLFIVVASIGFGSLLALGQAGQPVDALDNPLSVGLFYAAAVAGGFVRVGHFPDRLALARRPGLAQRKRNATRTLGFAVT